MKRLFDLLLALALTPLAIVTCAVAAVAIKLDSPGPAFFRQERVGQNRVPFTLFKLRTMKHHTPNVASHLAEEASVTRVGSVLRTTKLDELPQLWNVARGDMSFVGPRPCLPSQSLLIEERIRHKAFEARPGITGPAQLAGIDMSTPELLAEIDGSYVRENSLATDLRLLLATAAGEGIGDAVRLSSTQTTERTQRRPFRRRPIN